MYKPVDECTKEDIYSFLHVQFQGIDLIDEEYDYMAFQGYQPLRNIPFLVEEMKITNNQLKANIKLCPTLMAAFFCNFCFFWVCPNIDSILYQLLLEK